MASRPTSDHPQAARDQAAEDQQRGPGGKRRRQETRRQHRRQPERPARQAVVEECRHRVNADRPGNREDDDRAQPAAAGRRCAPIQRGPRDDDVQQQVAAERQHVPEHHRRGRRMEEHVQHPRRLAHVHEDEQDAHDARPRWPGTRRGRDAREGLAVVQVVGSTTITADGGHADEERELGDVETPGDVAPEAGDAQAGASWSPPDSAPRRSSPSRTAIQVQYCPPRSAFQPCRSRRPICRRHPPRSDCGRVPSSGLRRMAKRASQHPAHLARRIAAGRRRRRALRAGLDARGRPALGQPLLAERALLDHALRAGGYVRVRCRAMCGRGSPQLKLREPYGQRGHAVAAADAAVLVHHHDAVVSLPRGLRRADAHARRVVAVVAEDQHRRVRAMPPGRLELILAGKAFSNGSFQIHFTSCCRSSIDGTLCAWWQASMHARQPSSRGTCAGRSPSPSACRRAGTARVRQPTRHCRLPPAERRRPGHAQEQASC